MFETMHTEHLKGRKVLLEKPSGFALFLVKEFALQEEKNIWVHFSDPEYAIQVLVALGFRKVDNRTIARNCNDGPRKDLVQLIEKFYKTREELLKASIEKTLNITCICDGYTVGEVMWGIKNVLHEFIHEEGCKITPEYCLPVSKGLQEALRYYLVNIPPKVSFPKELSRSFDEYVGISDTIKDGLDSTKVLALVLVSELVEEYGFSKLHKAEMFQAKREDDLTMNDIEKIMGILDYLLNILELREKILMDVKLMEATRFSSHLSQVNEARVECGLGAVKMVNVG
ncbi:hypothetical protein PVAP13_1NG412319 [Panicum virgatum]|uniref:Uncharacterized protein n=1 Tax=Panicum virgatum TaxID=38727 RepID=A0A8T0WWE0_PANVG|nr:hypothetical protein PVAP13_1NG412319 [Panicum virgatum]